MNILMELNNLFSTLQIPVETGLFSGVAPDKYAVLTPLTEIFTLFGDDKPHGEVQEVRISVFSKGNYLSLIRRIVQELLAQDFTITDRRYMGHENDSGYHHYAIDIEKYYDLEE